jgi:integrase
MVSTSPLLSGRGVHPKLVQHLLGHASITITLDRYSLLDTQHRSHKILTSAGRTKNMSSQLHSAAKTLTKEMPMEEA